MCVIKPSLTMNPQFTVWRQTLNRATWRGQLNASVAFTDMRVQTSASPQERHLNAEVKVFLEWSGRRCAVHIWAEVMGRDGQARHKNKNVSYKM